MDEELIGREDEQAQLESWVTEALAGRESLVLFGGEAGVGKTTLVQRLTGHLGATGPPLHSSAALRQSIVPNPSDAPLPR